MEQDEIYCQCECGTVWMMDYEPPPEACDAAIWRLGINDEWGAWVDQNGNEVSVDEMP